MPMVRCNGACSVPPLSPQRVPTADTGTILIVISIFDNRRALLPLNISRWESESHESILLCIASIATGHGFWPTSNPARNLRKCFRFLTVYHRNSTQLRAESVQPIAALIST